MSDRKRNRDKLAQCNIRRSSKVFVDQNLQLEFPDLDPQAYKRSHSPIYSHYIGSPPSSLSLQVNENEFIQAMKDAEQSYEAWKQMKKKIEAATKKN